MNVETDPNEILISTLSINWVLATVNGQAVPTARRAKYQTNIPRWRLLFKQDGGQEIGITEDVLVTWQQIYHAAEENDVTSEEAFILATALTYDLTYVCFKEPWLEYFSNEFQLKAKSFEQFVEQVKSDENTQ